MECDAGGSVIANGLDNGDGSGTAANGQLEPGEVDFSTTFCSKLVTAMVKEYRYLFWTYSSRKYPIFRRL